MANISIKKKLIILFLIISIIPVLVSSIFFYVTGVREMNDFGQEQIKNDIAVMNNVIDNESSKLLMLAQKYANDEELNAAFKSGNREQLDKLLKPIYQRVIFDADISVIEYGDVNGVVFTRGHKPGKYGDDKSDNLSIKSALSGNAVSGFDYGSSGITLRAFVPIKDGDEIIGTLQLGANNRIFHTINNSMLSNIKFYNNDVLFFSSNDNDTELYGQQLDNPAIYENILAGDGYHDIDKNGNLNLFMAMTNATKEETIGIICISKDMSRITNYSKKVLTNTGTLIVIIFLVVLLISYFFSNQIAKPLQIAKNTLKHIAEGDLTITINEKSISKDEVGQLMGSLRFMTENVRGLVKDINTMGHTVSSSSQEMMVSCEEVTKVSEQVAQAVSDLAKGASEQAQSTERGNDNVKEIVDKISQMTSDMNRSDSLVLLAKNAVSNGEKAVKYQEIKMDESKQVTMNITNAMDVLSQKSSEVGQIVEVIKGIADQTNLLSLNAAIEAARAGELGQGFAVVAEEIRKLAEQSALSVQKIGDIISEVQTGVKHAVSEITKVGTVVDDQSNALNDTVQAFDEISEVVVSISDNIQAQLKDSLLLSDNAQQVSDAINDMASISQETAAGTEEVAASSEEQASITQHISQSAKELTQLADELQNKINMFKV